MRAVFTLVVLTACVAAAAACEPPDCGRPDMGTCGNACCKLSFNFNTDSSSIMHRLLALMVSGGPDGRYEPSMTAEGSLGFANLTKYNLPDDVKFLGQTIHHTKVHHYNDTINILIKGSGVNSVVEAFSTSQIAGALGDDGQNYKNIVQLMKAVNLPYQESTVFGCPPPTEDVPVVVHEPAFRSAAPLSLHASCTANYTFSSTSCESVSNGLVAAAKSLAGFASCGSSEKCGYSITSSSASEVTGKHETPVHHYKDDLSFALTSTGPSSCEVRGHSTSEVWYAVLDDGTNYCNLHNLVSATGLDFTEDIDKSACTQWSTANCDKY